MKRIIIIMSSAAILFGYLRALKMLLFIAGGSLQSRQIGRPPTVGRVYSQVCPYLDYLSHKIILAVLICCKIFNMNCF